MYGKARYGLCAGVRIGMAWHGMDSKAMRVMAWLCPARRGMDFKVI